MIRKIISRKGSKSGLLYRKCRRVTDFEAAAVRGVVKDLRDTLASLRKKREFKRGCGVAAPQIGFLLRVSVVNFKGREFVLINPEIVKTFGCKRRIREGCLSFFDYRGMVPRYPGVKVAAFNERGRRYFIETRDADFASLLQHEIDHLNGVLYVNRLPRKQKSLFACSRVSKRPAKRLKCFAR